MLRFRPDIKPPQWGPMSAVQCAVRANAARIGIDPDKFVQYLPAWERGGVQLLDVFGKPDYVAGNDPASYGWNVWGLNRTAGFADPSAGLVKPAIVGGRFTILQEIAPNGTWGRWYLANRSEFGFQVQNATLRIVSTIRASSAGVITSTRSHVLGQKITAVMSWDGTTFRAYSDGLIDGSTTPVAPANLQSGIMSLFGNSYNTGSNGATGQYIHIADILTAAQIEQLHYEPYTLLMPVAGPVYFDLGATAGTDNLTASDLVTGSPVLGTPALGQAHALTATGITTSVPVLGTPALGQVHGLNATALTVSAPVLGSPAVGQIHALTATALVVGSPALGTPSLTENAPDVDALTAVDLVVGSPVLGTPALGQIHVLGSDGLVTGVPVLGSPSITQIHTLEALGLTVGVPVLGAPALNGSDIVIITAAEVARIVSAASRMKTVTASARVRKVRYEVTRA